MSTAFAVTVGFAIFASLASVAMATPSRTTSCSGCHSGVNVAVSANLLSTIGNNATYSVSAPTAHSIAVFDGSTKLATINSASGQFTVTTGKTYSVMAVRGPSTSSGFGSTQVSPAVLVVDVTAPTTLSNAATSYIGSATVLLTAADNAGGSGVANTYYRLDGAAQVLGTTVVVSAAGPHALEFWSVDVAGNVETHRFAQFEIVPRPPATLYVPVAGSSRYETAVRASERTFASGAECVVIATGSNWPDALGGAALAAAEGGPILLTDANALPSAVAAEVTRLGATRAYILGGTGAVGP
ncbi:MAG: cell wall-binding repeat-containing protein, partial [Coriobacteriia bacterium]|nr:cell wall-binding repeat-containing protein [Coriobacteriia bacterium]